MVRALPQGLGALIYCGGRSGYLPFLSATDGHHGQPAGIENDFSPAEVQHSKYMPTLSHRTEVPTIRCDATLYTIDGWTILRLPEKASGKLPSRGQVAVKGTINGHGFQTVLEPDGHSGHWMRIDRKLQQTAALRVGDTATLEIESLKDWPEPNVPQDLETALAGAPQRIQDLWKGITPMARWEWVRWVNATPNPDTRKRRVEVSISKMEGGKRRPCCFNLAACTDPNLSRSGRLIETS
jgi:Domain of unknown function (DUF1905)/Bacteriocin-protection, YdeI or OmpD-Associated